MPATATSAYGAPTSFVHFVAGSARRGEIEPAGGTVSSSESAKMFRRNPVRPFAVGTQRLQRTLVIGLLSLHDSQMRHHAGVWSGC